MTQSFDTKVKSALGLIPQPNSWTCQSTCIGMVTGNQDIMGIRARLEITGEPGDPAVMGVLLREHFGDLYHFDSNASLSEARDYLKQGAFLIVHGYFTDGHVIALNGVEIDSVNQSYRFKVLDPWSEFDFKAWTYDGSSSIGYSGYYSSYGIYAACVAGQSKWDASAVYQRGELESSRRGMWLHVITP